MTGGWANLRGLGGRLRLLDGALHELAGGVSRSTGSEPAVATLSWSSLLDTFGAAALGASGAAMGAEQREQELVDEAGLYCNL